MNIEKVFLVLAVVCLIVVVLVFTGTFNSHKLGVISANMRLGVNSSTTIGAVNTKFFSVSTGAQLRRCYNTGVGDVTYSVTTTQLVAGKSGDVIKASTTIEWSGDSLWTGELYGVTPVNATTVLACMEI